MSGEEWRPVPGFPGYEVSSLGRVVSRRRGKPRLLSGFLARGYRKVTLQTGGSHRGHFVHGLVAAAFIGPRPDGMEVCHQDGDRLNNRVENLRYGTRSENTRDSLRHGTHAQAAKTHCPAGHPYSPENTYRESRGRRVCRVCRVCKTRRMGEYRRRQALRLRLVYDPTPVMAGSLCLRETTPHEPCTRPYGHDGDCGDLDAAIRHHPAGNRLTHRCPCGHGPSTHTGGYGQCWQHPCGCDRYTDREESKR